MDCTSLFSIKIPPHVTKVNPQTFCGCTSLKKAVLGENLLKIEEEAFSECDTLLRITIPSSIKSIAKDTFRSCGLLRNVLISSASKLTQEMYMQSFITLSNMRVTLDMIMHRFDELPLHKFCLDYNSSLTHKQRTPLHTQIFIIMLPDFQRTEINKTVRE